MHINGVCSPFPEEGFRPASSLARFGMPSTAQPTAHKTRPNKLTAYHVPQTTAHLLKNRSDTTSNRTNNASLSRAPDVWRYLPQVRNDRSEETNRAQSATVVRPNITDTRQVKSASRNHRTSLLDSPPSSSSSHNHNTNAAGNDDNEKPPHADREMSAAASRSDESVNSDASSNDDEEEDAAAASDNDAGPVEEAEAEEEPPRLPTPPQLNYDEQLEKHGWRMEVPGDPLGLKTPCLPKRLSLNFLCHTLPPRKDPPTTHTENVETFFHNTIAKHPLSYDINPHFASEVLHAKRIEYQRRAGGVDYRFKDFSFVY